MQLQAIATTRAGNLHTRVLANAIADLPLRGKSIQTILNCVSPEAGLSVKIEGSRPFRHTKLATVISP